MGIDLLAGCGDSDAPAASSPTTSTPALRLAQGPWVGSKINVAIIKVLLNEQFGMNVEVKDVDAPSMAQGLAGGELHAALEFWPTTHSDDFTGDVQSGRLEDGGGLGVTGRSGWYVPRYMLQSTPTLATSDGLLDPSVAGLFKATDSAEKGRIWVSGPSSGAREATLAKNLKLPLTVYRTDSDDELVQHLDKVYGQQGPMLLYLWLPHWAHEKYDLFRVPLPEYTPACYANAATGGVDCDYPSEGIRKVFWPGLSATFAQAYPLLRQFHYAPGDQIALIKLVGLEHKTIREAARVWVEQYQSIWQAWLDG